MPKIQEAIQSNIGNLPGIKNFTYPTSPIENNIGNGALGIIENFLVFGGVGVTAGFFGNGIIKAASHYKMEQHAIKLLTLSNVLSTSLVELCYPPNLNLVIDGENISYSPELFSRGSILLASFVAQGLWLSKYFDLKNKGSK